MKYYYNYSYKNILNNRVFKIISFTLIIFSLLGFIIELFLRDYLPSLPEDKLIVAITDFVGIGNNATDEAMIFSHRIEQQISEKIKKGIPVKTKRIFTQVKGLDDEEKRKSAIEIGNSKEGNAHIVIWGEVRKDQDELYSKIRLTISRNIKGGSPYKEYLRIGIFDDYQQIEFKEIFANEIADVLTFICGIAYLNTNNYDRAIEVLGNVNSIESCLYIGVSLIERSDRSLHPQNDLRDAIKYFEKLIRGVPIDSMKYSDKIGMQAYINIAFSYNKIAQFSNKIQAIDYLIKSQKIYFNLLNRADINNNLKERAVIQFDIGTNFNEIGRIVAGELGIKYLVESSRRYQIALQSINCIENTILCALIKNNLGMNLYNLSLRSDTKEKGKMLNEAQNDIIDALSIFNLSSSPFEWALAKKNLAVILREKGISSERDENVNILNDAMNNCREALKVYTQNKYPIEWGEVQHLLGGLLMDLGLRTDNKKEFLNVIERAYKCFENALSVIDPKADSLYYGRIYKARVKAGYLIDSLRSGEKK